MSSLEANRRPIKSTSQAWADGTHRDFNEFVPTIEHGKRVVIDGIWVVANVTDFTTATGAALAGEDKARIFKRIEIVQTGGRKRWNLRGDESRIACYLLDGPELYSEGADVAVVSNGSFVYAMYIPLAKRFAKRPRDYALPADLLENVRIECASEAELTSVAGAAVTINAAQYYVIAETHLEKSIELKSEDEVYSQALPQTAGGKFTVNGRLQELALFARGASGGADVSSAFTGLRIEGLIPKQLNRTPDLLERYRRDRFAAANLNSTMGGELRADPFTNGRAVPVLWSTGDTSNFHGKLSGLLELELDSTLTNPIAIARRTLPRSEDVESAVQRHYGLPPQAFRMKTEAKTKRDPNKGWPADKERFMPKSAPMPRSIAG